ncbi:secretion/conjugation apparatus DotM-related subunit [Cysteiniphilum sp. 6C5]|uniref:secretion/conjugation apparatus DotM-related subunit n=1 Tax=unclassified Cysteiniphilum TaxID=2610889 RepID=UPI003F843129
MSRQQGMSEDNSLTHIFIAGSIIFLGFVAYYFFAAYINRAYIQMMHFELSVFGFFSHNASALKNQLMHIDASHISFSELMSLNNQAGLLLRLPVAIILGFLICAVMLLHPKKLFNVYYDMAKLAKKMVSHFKHITPVIDQHLEQTSPKEGVWASALSSSDFIKQYGLYSNDSQLDENKLEQQLVKQLGQKFNAFDDLSINEQILFTVFALRIAGKDAKAQCLLEKASTNAIDHKALNVLSESVLEHPEVSAICQKHAYVRTLLCGLLAKARSTGILATASFLWLKTKDRTLWYTLNNVGRQAVFIEGASAFGHWQTENAVGFKVETPLFEQLIKTIKDQQ